MRWPTTLRRVAPAHLLGTVAAISVAVAIVLIVTSSGAGRRAPVTTSHTPVSRASSARMHIHAVMPQVATSTAAPHHPPAAPTPSLGLARSLGQLIVARFTGTSPSPSILAAIKGGRVGGVILFSDNTAGGLAATGALVGRLQDAARAGGNPGLLIMTDQEGGEVKRLPGPPSVAASQMGAPAFAEQQGAATAALLRSAGVNVDLAPVADVSRVGGFMTQEHRTFGASPAVVAAAACAFAVGLSSGGIAYTLKHFPGLGDAISSTDAGPVAINESSGDLSADEAAYRRCGGGSRALVMMSSASYPSLTGSTPAVLSASAYGALGSDGIRPVTISDDFQTPALAGQPTPARRAINAGLDLVLYAETEAASAQAYSKLYNDLRRGSLPSTRVRAAASQVLALKRTLGLG